jgi:uncharacterized protein YndB with AHSA1/START domain
VTRWLAVVAVIVIGVPAVVVLAGTMLPRDHLATMSITLRAEPARVWALVSDVGGTARWRPDVKAVEAQTPVEGRERFVEVGRHGRTPFEVVFREPPGRQVVRVLDDGMPFGGTWTYELAPSGEGTRLTISEAGFIRNPVFRVMSRIAFPPTATMDAYLRALAAELGENAEPVVIRVR